MPWSGRPDTDPADAVRSLVGDKDTDRPLLADEEYTKFLADAYSNVRRAAHMAAMALAGQYARKADITSGSVRKSNGQIAKSFQDLAASLLASVSGDGAAVQLVAPLTGGIVDPISGGDIAPFFTRDYP